MAVSKIILSKDLMDKVIEELTEYRAIGTVEEFKELLEYRAIGSVDKIKGSIETNYVLLHAYEEIGTVEEFKALKEKSEPKKPTVERVKFSHNQYADNYKCPVCGERMISRDETGWYSGRRSKYCPNCGQKLDWQ